MKFYHFTGASAGWRDRVADRLDDAIRQHGEDVGDYIVERIERSPWGSYERRRWKLALAMLEERQQQKVA